jgi:hypothetical protein
MGGVFQFEQFEPLSDPVIIGANWLYRPYYSIRLFYNNQSGAGFWGTRRTDYSIRVNLAGVPADRLDEAILLVFSDIFDICKRNQTGQIGSQFCRVHFKSESLNRNINFSRLDFNDKEKALEQLSQEINNVLQSNENLFLADDLKIGFISYDTPNFYNDQSSI